MPETVLRDRSNRPVLSVSDDALSIDLFGRACVVGAITTQGISDHSFVISDGVVIAQASLPIPAGGQAGAGFRFSSTANFGMFFGSGAPTLSAAKGSLYLRSDGVSNITRAYVNTDGGTTWTAINTVA